MFFAPFLFLAIAVIFWAINGSSYRFPFEFAGLLTEPLVTGGPFRFLTGRFYVSGKYKGRDVAVRVQLKRGKFERGYLVIAVRTGEVLTVDYNGIEAMTRNDEAAQRALFAVATHDLLLSVEDGWLKTLWDPMTFLVFPGRFSAEKWRPVLEAMQIVALSLEVQGQKQLTASENVAAR